MEQERITISEGGGGKHGFDLVKNIFLETYGNDILNRLDDAAEIEVREKRIAFTTDSYTIKPVFFPGGNIGNLAVCGTCNDLAVKGARPVALSAAFIIEEGFPKHDLVTIARSMHEATSALGVPIVTGDTKVVSRGEVDGIFINTAGIGAVMDGMNISASRAQPGDAIITTGTIGDHGIAILNEREQLEFSLPVHSDVAAVFPLVEKIAFLAGHIHVMRDPTRGGMASILNEIAYASRVCVTIGEDLVPIQQGVLSCCDLLGLDPLYLPNEGRIILVVAHEAADEVLSAVRSLPLGKDAAIVGTVTDDPFSEETPPVSLETGLGTRRYLPLMEGDPLPRIC